MAPPNTFELNTSEVTLLALIHEYDETRVRTKQRMQKLTFLLDEETKFDLWSWKKYDYGPYSKMVNRTLKRLSNKDLLILREKPTLGGNIKVSYELTETGRDVINKIKEDTTDDQEQLFNDISTIINKHGDTPISNLTDYVREEHPKYWENSVYKY